MTTLSTLSLLIGLRTLDGAVISTPPMVLVTWDLDCTACLATLAELDRLGVPAVALSLDGADRQSEVRARTARLAVEVVADTDGAMLRSLGLVDHPRVWMLGPDCRLRSWSHGEALAQLRGPSFHVDVVACAAMGATP